MQKLISSPHAEQSPISRDKIAVSRRRGIWVGGPVPLGYASINKKLVMAPEDARLSHQRAIGNPRFNRAAREQASNVKSAKM
jgi:hypothetical protein